MLLRDWVQRCVHLRQSQLAQVVETCLNTPLDFKIMIGEGDYKKAIGKAYAAKPLAPVTPLEVFAPHYSQALGAYILANHKRQVRNTRGSKRPAEPLVIYEAGGGAGANAGHIMDLLRTRAPDVYATARYTLVQPCAALAERQRLRLSAAHRRQVQVVSGRGVAEWAGALEVDPRPCYVLGLDFLGTLPHDKVAYKRLQEGGPVQLCEAIISDEPDGRVAETYQPLADGSIARVLELCPDLIKSLASPPEHEGLLPAAKQFLRTVMRSSRRVDGAVFVPTGALHVMEALHRSFPKHRLLLADFDSVGEPSVTRKSAAAYQDTITGAHLAPLVSTSDPKTGFTEDQSSYLLPPGSADLCFPTDFGSLKQVYSQVTGRSGGSVHVMKQSAFFELQKTEAAAAQTRNGYNPMLEDFGNYSMLIGQ